MFWLKIILIRLKKKKRRSETAKFPTVFYIHSGWAKIRIGLVSGEDLKKAYLETYLVEYEK